MPSAGSSVSDGGRRRQRGSAALSTVGAYAVLLLFVTLVAQFAVWGYTRAAVRAAALEGARAAAPLDALPGACERRFQSVRSGLLAGRLGAQVGEVDCEFSDDLVTVTVDVDLERWLPLSPDWSFRIESIAVREVAPS